MNTFGIDCILTFGHKEQDHFYLDLSGFKSAMNFLKKESEIVKFVLAETKKEDLENLCKISLCFTGAKSNFFKYKGVKNSIEQRNAKYFQPEISIITDTPFKEVLNKEWITQLLICYCLGYLQWSIFQGCCITWRI